MSETTSGATVIFLGASTRSAAGSALRAGWTPWCVDLFADADLERSAAVCKVPLERYPQGLIDALCDAPQAPVIYTGALENYPDLVGRIDRPLWGNSPKALRAVRSPARWTYCLTERGLSCPAYRDEPTEAGRWLLKPRRSAGGLGIQVYTGQAFQRRTHFLQEEIDGEPCSALFLGNHGNAILLGVTAQLVGIPWLHASGFLYCGNIGPVPQRADVTAHWGAIGAALAGTFHLQGLFGVDGILRDGVPWPIEINPRYTASVELLERCYRMPLLALHRAVFERDPMPTFNRPTPSTVHGKAILYARETLAFPACGPWQEGGIDLDEAAYADIPHAGEIIERGRPVLTLFASGTTVADCESKLREKARALDRRLWG